MRIFRHLPGGRRALLAVAAVAASAAPAATWWPGTAAAAGAATAAGAALPTPPAPAPRTPSTDDAVAVTPAVTGAVGQAQQLTVTASAPAGASSPSFVIGVWVTPSPSEESDTCATPTVDGDTATCVVTVDSASAAIYTVSATAQITVGGVTVDRSTDGDPGTGGSGPGTATFVDARISLSGQGVVAVGGDDLLSVTVQVDAGAGWRGAPDGTVVGLSVAAGPGSLSTPDCLTEQGLGVCQDTISSPTAGQSDVAAAASVAVDGVELVRATGSDAGPAGSGDLAVDWVGAALTVGPDTAGPVGVGQTLTVTVTAEPDGVGPVDVTGISPSVSPAGDLTGDSCATPVVAVDEQSASCTVTVDSTSPAAVVVDATADLTIDGVAVTATSGGAPAATATFVDARITVGPGGTQAVGTSAPLTGHVDVDTGGGWQPAPDGTTITFATVSGPGTLSVPACTTAGGTGSCPTALSSAAAGITEVSATATVTVDGVAVTRSTGAAAGPGGSQAAQVRFVDASVALSPGASAPAGVPQTVTARVEVDDGTGDGLQPAPDGTVVDLAVVSGPGRLSAPSCTTAGGTGSCQVTVDSPEAGTTVVSASAMVAVDGIAVVRTTAAGGDAGPGGSGNLVEQWTVPPTSPSTGSDVTTSGPPPAPATAALAFTGGWLAVEAAAAVGLGLIGGLLVLMGRRRRSTGEAG